MPRGPPACGELTCALLRPRVGGEVPLSADNEESEPARARDVNDLELSTRYSSSMASMSWRNRHWHVSGGWQVRPFVSQSLHLVGEEHCGGTSRRCIPVTRLFEAS